LPNRDRRSWRVRSDLPQVQAPRRKGRAVAHARRQVGERRLACSIDDFRAQAGEVV